MTVGSNFVHAGRLGHRHPEREEQRRGDERLPVGPRRGRRRRHLHRPDPGERQRAGRRRRRELRLVVHARRPRRVRLQRRRGRRGGDDELARSQLGQRPLRRERRAQRRHLEPREQHGRGAGRDRSPAATRPGSTASAAPTRPPSGSTASTPPPGRRARTPWARSSRAARSRPTAPERSTASAATGRRRSGPTTSPPTPGRPRPTPDRTSTEGGALVYLNVGGTEYVYATMGGNKTFKRYNVGRRTPGPRWRTRRRTSRRAARSPPTARTSTSCAATSTRSSSATTSPPTPGRRWRPLPVNVGWGGSLTCIGGSIYALSGDGKKNFYRYNIAANTWTDRCAATRRATWQTAVR